jgi:hypothetical protein
MYRGTISICAIEYEKQMKLCAVTTAHNLYRNDTNTAK